MLEDMYVTQAKSPIGVILSHTYFIANGDVPVYMLFFTKDGNTAVGIDRTSETGPTYKKVDWWTIESILGHKINTENDLINLINATRLVNEVKLRLR